jgi:hypothetical protein
MELEGYPEANAEIRAARQLQYFVSAHKDPKSIAVYEVKDFLPEWLLSDGSENLEEDDDQQIDPVVAKRASEKMASLGGLFR